MADPLITILIVDDDETEIYALQQAFKQNHIFNPLFIATDGMEALDKLRGTNGEVKITPAPRIILLDLNMPRMGGLEFLRELRADPDLRTAGVFVLTSSNDEKDRIEAYRYNVAGYILKPVSFERFVSAVATLKNLWQLYYNGL